MAEKYKKTIRKKMVSIFLYVENIKMWKFFSQKSEIRRKVHKKIWKRFF